MSDRPTEPRSSAGSTPGPSWRRWLFAVLPHMLTIVLAVAIAFALQAALLRPSGPAFVAPAPDIVRQELLDLRAEDDRLWAAIYLARAISQVSDAEAQMRANDLESVAQSLVAVDGSLELAYERADESIKSPIAELRR